MAAATVDHHDLRPTSLPLIDLRLLTRTELLTLSRHSPATTPTTIIDGDDDDDRDSTPKIDAKVFNESAGSRKQTFSRLRLAPRNSSSAFRPQIQPPPPPSAIVEDNSELISLFTSLLNIDSSQINTEDDDPLFSVPVELENTENQDLLIGPQNIPVELVTCTETKKKRGRPKRNDSTSTTRWVISSPNQVNEQQMASASALALAPAPAPSSSAKRRRGRPRKNDPQTQNVLPMVSSDAIVAVTDDYDNNINNNNSENMLLYGGGSSEAVAVACEARKRKPGRPRKNENPRN